MDLILIAAAVFFAWLYLKSKAQAAAAIIPSTGTLVSDYEPIEPTGSGGVAGANAVAAYNAWLASQAPPSGWPADIPWEPPLASPRPYSNEGMS